MTYGILWVQVYNLWHIYCETNYSPYCHRSSRNEERGNLVEIIPHTTTFSGRE